MSKVRVYELARDLSVESKQLMTRIKALGIDVSSHQSTLTAEQIAKIKKAFNPNAANNTESAAKSNANGSGQAASAAAASKVLRRRKVVVATETEEGVETLKEVSEVFEVGAEKSPTKIRRKEGPAVASDSSEVAAVSDVVKETEVVARDATAPKQSSVDTVVATKPASPATGSGATIVRKATREEIEKAEHSAGSIDRMRRTARKEDSRGVRVTGIGFKEVNKNITRPQTESAPEFVSEESSSNEKEFKKSRRDLDEEGSEVKRKSAAKSKKSSERLAVNLLKKIDINELEDIEGPVTDALTRRTYTPTGFKKNDIKRKKNLKKTQITTPRAELRIVQMGSTIKVGEFAKQLSVKAGEIIKKLMTAGEMVSINDLVDLDTATLIAGDYGFEVKSIEKSLKDILKQGVDRDLDKPKLPRPPVVTVMGHVDHGKTSVLDTIRNTNIASGEAGGITQHIGAYTVQRGNQLITFLDTPGHAAFSEMRSRGAKITDIVVLVVAADDGVMPQTVEAINHAKAAGVPIIVAVNKIDKGEKGLDKIFTQLTEYGIQSEEWGGETQFIKVSALKKIGIEALLDAIILQAEVLDLKAPYEGKAEGVVIESHLDVGLGPVATVLVSAGTLEVGSFLVAGLVSGRVRSMKDFMGKSIQSATPSIPVKITGLEEVPMAGDSVNVVESEKVAKDVVAWRRRQALEQGVNTKVTTLDALFDKIKQGDVLTLPLILKADTQGSLEAINEALMKLNTDQITNNVIHRAVGGITESDLRLAETSGAVVIGFNVRAARGLDLVAEKLGVTINYYNVIYNLVDAVKTFMAGKLPTIKKEVVQGHAEVRDLITISRVGNVAGSAVLDGKIIRGSNLRLLRDDVIIYEGKLGSLRRFKEDVKEVSSGFECGITIQGFNDIKPGDIIEAYVIEEEAATL